MALLLPLHQDLLENCLNKAAGLIPRVSDSVCPDWNPSTFMLFLLVQGTTPRNHWCARKHALTLKLALDSNSSNVIYLQVTLGTLSNLSDYPFTFLLNKK